MKKIVLAIAVLVVAYFGLQGTPALQQLTDSPVAQEGAAQLQSNAELLAAIRDQRGGVQVTGEGRVTKLLTDDNEGSRHQRFILRLSTGQTLLVAHNIDLAPRISDLQVGDTIAFHGVYEWNDKGGVIHWTHRDPGGRHAAGWLRHAGQTYE